MNTKNKLLQMILGSMIGAIIFSCQKDEEVVPLFKDLYINDIGLFSAKLYSSFETEQTDFLECGFVVSTNEIHSLEDGIKYAVQPQRGRQMRLTLQELELATEYFVRSYIIRANGGDVKFIEEQRFTTLGLDAIVDTTDLIVSRMDTVGIGFADSIHTIADQLEFFVGENKVTSVVVSPTLINIAIPNDIVTDKYPFEIKYKDRLFEINKSIEILQGQWRKSNTVEWVYPFYRTRSFHLEDKIYVFGCVNGAKMMKYDIAKSEWKESVSFNGDNLDHTAYSFDGDGFGYLGGITNDDEGRLYRFDPYLDVWILLSDTSILKRGDVPAFSVNNNLYFPGGLDVYTLKIRDLYQYNVESNEWKMLANAEKMNSYGKNFNTLFPYFHTTTSKVLNNQVYFFGGSYHQNQEYYDSDLLMIFNPLDTTFREGMTMPHTFSNPFVSYFDTKFIVGPTKYGPRHPIYLFDPLTSNWTRLSRFPLKFVDQWDRIIFCYGQDEYVYLGELRDEKLTIWEFDPNY